MEEKDKQYLVALVKKAKNKIQEQYDVEIKKEILIDEAKTLEQNRDLIIQMVKSEKDLLLKDKPLTPIKSVTTRKSKEEREKEEQVQAKIEAEKLKKIKEEETKTINEWKKQFNPSMVIKSPAYFEMESLVKMVCKGFSNFCVVHSQGGLSKTWSTQAILKKMKVDYAYLNSFTSPLELYNFLYDNSDGKVILIDDCEGIWENKCIPYYTKVKTENGRKKIYDLKVGDKVLSYNKDKGKTEYKRIINKATSIRKIVRIHTSLGVLESSEEHKWIVFKNDKLTEKKAKDLNTDDVLVKIK